MLYELEDAKGVSGIDFERLDLTTNPFLERNFDNLLEYIDDLLAEQGKYQYWQRSVQRQEAQKAAYLKRKKSEEAAAGAAPSSVTSAEEQAQLNQMFKSAPAPSRLESLLVTSQINNYCEQITQFAGQGFGKLFMVAGLHQSGGKEEGTVPATSTATATPVQSTVANCKG